MNHTHLEISKKSVRVCVAAMYEEHEIGETAKATASYSRRRRRRWRESAPSLSLSRFREKTKKAKKYERDWGRESEGKRKKSERERERREKKFSQRGRLAKKGVRGGKRETRKGVKEAEAFARAKKEKNSRSERTLLWVVYIYIYIWNCVGVDAHVDTYTLPGDLYQSQRTPVAMATKLDFFSKFFRPFSRRRPLQLTGVWGGGGGGAEAGQRGWQPGGERTCEARGHMG